MIARPRIRWVVALALLSLRALPASAQSADSAWAHRDHAAARRLYQARLAADSSDTVALFRLAQMEAWAGRHKQSLAWIEQLIRVAPADLEARAARARCLAALGRFDDGLALADSMLNAQPGSVVALQTRARFAFWNGEAARSEMLWQRALLVDPDNVETRIGLSAALRRLGRSDEAAAMIAPARTRAPADADVRDEADRVASLLRPRLRSAAGRETDSDGNAVLTWLLSAAAPAAPGVQLRADAYIRDAEIESAVSRSVTTRGATAAASLDLRGWRLETAAGASASSAQGAGTLPALAVSLATPRNTRAVASLALSRTPWDYTVPMAENLVVVDEVRLDVDWLLDRRWSAQLTGGIARFDVRRQNLGNRRWSAQGRVLHTLGDRVALGLGARAFGFDRDLSGGYYDPDFYGLADARLALRLGTGRWALDADVAPGVQQAGRGADLQAALHAAGELSFSVRPGRRIGLRTVWANTGLNQLSPGAVSSYHYAAATLTLGWWF